jgi:hypothetical protein
MGKSDPYIFAEYAGILPKFDYESIAFLGQHVNNEFSDLFTSKVKHFYDLQLGNWEINSDWYLQQTYDLIICTRCAYFSKDPEIFVKKIKDHLTKDGIALIDWGLGDHWRFENYKVGWVRQGEHEFAYNPNNFLYSCYWNDNLLLEKDVKEFWNAVRKNPSYGYENCVDLVAIINSEIPKIITYDAKKIKTKFLWKESPQLYIITVI